MSDSRTKRDIMQITQFEHDEVNNAKRVTMVDTEISMELDHNDGDSVTAHPEKLSVSSIGVDSSDSEVVPAMSCSSIKRLQMYVDTKSGLRSGSLVIQVSPLDSGDVWYTKSTVLENSNQSEILDICARRLRVIQTNPSGTFELDVHLVGQG